MWKLLKYLFYIIGGLKLLSLCKQFIRSFFEEPKIELDKETLKAELDKFEVGDNICDQAIINAINWRMDRNEELYNSYIYELNPSANDHYRRRHPTKLTNIALGAFDAVTIWTKSLEFNGYNVLHYTARYGSLAIIKHLMSCGFRFDLVSTAPVTFNFINNGRLFGSVMTILHSAILNLDINVLRTFLECYPQLKPNKEHVAFALCAGHMDAAKFLCDNYVSIRNENFRGYLGVEEQDIGDTCVPMNIASLDFVIKSRAHLKGYLMESNSLFDMVRLLNEPNIANETRRITSNKLHLLVYAEGYFKDSIKQLFPLILTCKAWNSTILNGDFHILSEQLLPKEIASNIFYEFMGTCEYKDIGIGMLRFMLSPNFVERVQMKNEAIKEVLQKEQDIFVKEQRERHSSSTLSH